MIPRASARIRSLFARSSRNSAPCALALLLLFGALAARAQVPTTITITVSNSSPTYTTPSSPGAAAALTPTFLTAQVTETASGKPVTGGTVTFYDQAPLDRTQAADPLGMASIQGTPYLAPAGQATLAVDLGAGLHTLTAIYNGASGNTAGGVPNWARSATTPLAVTVSGQAQSQATLNLVGADGSFILYDPSQPVVSGDLYVYGYGMQYPPGTGTIVDQTTNTFYDQPAGTSLQELYSSLGKTINLNAPAAGVTSFILADPYRAGVPSIVAFYSALNAVYTVDINRAQATPVAASTATGCTPCSVAGSPVQGVAFDMNNDGLLDIVVAHNDTSGAGVGVGILFNTLQQDPGVTAPQKTFGSPEVTYHLGHPISYVAAGDVNGDGKPDIVALTADGTNLVIVLTNNGDGTFTQQPVAAATGNGPVQIGLADFNYDGKLDLAVLNSLDNTVGILLGNGDGTFQAMTTSPAAPSGLSAVPQVFTIARLANNHVLTPYLDIAVLSVANYNLEYPAGFLGGTVLLGAGDGTFTPKYYNFGFGDFATNGPTYTAPISGLQAADVDGDGLPDLVFSYPNNDLFQPLVYDAPSDSYPFEDGYSSSGASSTPVGNFRSVGIGVGDINGDGVNDYVLMNPDNSALYPGKPTKNAITIFLNTLYSQDQIPALITAPGAHTVVAGYSPATGSIYAPAQTDPTVVNVPLPGIASFSTNPVNFGSVAVGSTATQTLTITDTGTGPLEISFDYLSNNAAGVYNIPTDGCSGTTLAAGGSCTVTLTFTPTAAGPASGALTVNDTQVGSPQIVPVNGTGMAAAGGTNTGTTIVLTSSNLAPNYVTPTNGGSGSPLNPVTLTATVTVTATGQPVTGGSVTFYDNPGLPGNAGPSAIGTANVQFPVGGDGALNGVATLPFAFGPGSHNLTATYSGTPFGPPAGYGFLPATTANPLVLTTSGFGATEYGFSMVGNQGTEILFDPENSLTGTIYNPNQDPLVSYPFIFAFGLQVPTGTTTLTDQTTGIVYPSTVVPEYADKLYPIYDPQLGVYDSGGYVYGDYVYSLGAVGVTNFFTADVFQSGVPALVTLSALYNQVLISDLYSNPNNYAGCNGATGTNPTCAVSTPPVQGVASDINGDGHLDLIIAHNDPSGAGSVGIFMNTLGLCTGGTACGVFNAAEVTYATGHPASNVAVGDVNGDGFPDIVATSSDGSNLVSILLNNGNGTLALSPTTYGTGNGVSQLALGDFNHDGILDIAVLNKADQTIGILNGNGDGSFGAMSVYTVGTNPTAFAVADLNLDGFLDFAITNNDSPTQAEVSFLYGAAGGVFNYTANLAANQLSLGAGGYPETNPQPTSITATDLDGDGYPDLVIGFNVNTFTYAMYQPATGAYSYIGNNTFEDQPNGINIRTSSTVAVDLDGDGVKDLLFMPTINNNIVCAGCSPSYNNLMVHYDGAMTYEWIAPTAITAPLGNHTIVSNFTPSTNSIYGPATAGPVTIDILAEPNVSLTPTSLTFNPQQINTTSPAMVLTLRNTGSGPMTSVAFQIVFQNPATPGGFTVTNVDCPATLVGGAPPCTANVTFNPGQTGSYTGYVALTYGAGTTVYVQLTGTGVNYPTVNVSETINLNDAVSASMGKMVSVNETIVLSDAVNASVAHPVAVVETIHLTDATTAAQAGTPIDVNESIHLSDAVSAGTVVVINDVEAIHVTDIDTPLLSVAINDVEAIHVTDTDVPVLAVQISDNESIHVTDVDSPTILLGDTTNLSVSATTIPVGGSVILTATVAPASGATVPTGNVGFYDGATLLGTSTLAGGSASYTATTLGVGSHMLSAQYLGNSTFTTSTSSTVQVTVSSMNILTVTPQSVSRNFGVSNPAFGYTITGFVNGDTISVVTGTVTLSTTATLASLAGGYPIAVTANTLAAPANYVFSFATGTLTVNGNSPQTITFAAIPNVPLAAHQLTLTAHSNSGSLGQPIVYTVTGSATISGNTLTLTGVGSVTVTASEAGNSTFSAATSVARTFSVTP
ncbi:Repeat domain-containing protein [Granulicella rosea]|uniref:Repeat domain-containing protein n=2 Tax=Granulicella rosea TaxID=474952 RepID=A0A239GT15_9BACT|nr:Repeat domain-containing protein [Granulicella rosea]